jgi:mono/diheme cytochrome c family protein
MHDQPKYEPLEESTFFADGQASRAPVPGTVARGQLYEDTLLHTGKDGDRDAQVFPFRIDAQVMQRGRERFDIFCAPCHGRTGDGNGMIVQRGFQRPAPLADERLRQAPVGYLFNVVTHGFGAMPDHAAQIPPQDRWAIAAYIRALQLSATATIDDVPAAERSRLGR